jgi:hypothetical protein
VVRIENICLIFEFQGRDFRLTDRSGNVVRDILAWPIPPPCIEPIDLGRRQAYNLFRPAVAAMGAPGRFHRERSTSDAL